MVQNVNYVVIRKSIVSELRRALLHPSLATPNGVCCATEEESLSGKPQEQRQPSAPRAMHPGNGLRAAEFPSKTWPKSN